MIVTDLAHARTQIPPTPAMQKALAFLESIQGKEVPPGRIEIAGEEVYALVSSYQTVLQASPLAFEAHRKYIDLHYLISGQEVIGWASTARLSVTREYNAAQEAWFGALSTGQPAFAWLGAGDVAVMYPEDGHAPRLAAGEPETIGKIVVKVAVGS